MQTLPIRSERLAELEEFARRRGKTLADALDEALAEYLGGSVRTINRPPMRSGRVSRT
jgi:hypothetical protein